ncbi:hypothetical protein BDP27DRAFT_1294681 [Rhodocollybia butyracea]|uniref:DUS-like FMN-binding domain-containing protein n=1 Tax=Rhodocollybia butyracea TaxID=206335 RepID=A0A9P5PT80_9AGAR|nr:hypothetical protein BDP27DRAFT_1294681 [Rhodocollybia butyracea]
MPKAVFNSRRNVSSVAHEPRSPLFHPRCSSTSHAPEITVTAKIRLPFPSQEDSLKLVERIVSVLTVHCRTRNMRNRDKAMIERLKEVADFVKGMGKDIAVIENGHCLGAEDAERVRQITGAHSLKQPNPILPVFRKHPSLTFIVHETFVPSYLQALSRYFNNHWSLTKFCVFQFKSPHMKVNGKAEDRCMW